MSNFLFDKLNIAKLFIIITGLTYAFENLLYIRYFLVLIACILILSDIVMNFRYFLKLRFIILGLFLLQFLIISVVYNNSVKNFIECINLFLFIYGLVNFSNDIKSMKLAKFVSIIFIIASAFIAIIDLIMFVMYYSGRVYIIDHYEPIGMYEGRLWGIFNANITAFIALASILFTVIILMNNNRYKKLMYINIVLQMHVFILAQSRTMMFIFLILLVYYISFIKYKLLLLRYKLIITGLVMLIMITIPHIYVSKILYVIPNTIHKINVSNNVDDEEIQLERNSTTENVSQGRSELWEDSFKVIKKSVLFGNGLRPLYEDAVNNFSDRWYNVVKLAGVHNIYIMILVVSGLVGLILFLIFVFSTIVKFGKAIFINTNEDYIKLLMLFILMLFFEELLESRMLYINNYFTLIFWFGVGYCYNYIEKKNNN